MDYARGAILLGIESALLSEDEGLLFVLAPFVHSQNRIVGEYGVHIADHLQEFCLISS